MKHFKLFLFLNLVFLFQNTFGVIVTLENPPADYNVYTLSGKSLRRTHSAGNFQEFKFDLPSEHIIKDKSGEIDLSASLEHWRKNTGIGPNHPRTDSRKGVVYYPFKDPNGNYKHIALNHVFRNYKSKVKVGSVMVRPIGPDTIISQLRAKETEKLEAAKTAAEEKEKQRRLDLEKRRIPDDVLKKSASMLTPQNQLSAELSDEEKARREDLVQRRIPDDVLKEAAQSLKTNNNNKVQHQEPSSQTKQDQATAKINPANYKGPHQNTMKMLLSMYQSGTRSVDCTKNSGIEAQCLVCNCANETSGVDASKVEVNRTVLTRSEIRGRPSTFCGVIWQDMQFSWTRPTKAVRKKYNWKNVPSTHSVARLSVHRKVSDPKVLKSCLLASMSAVASGPNGYDMYHNPKIARPSWRAEMKHRGERTVGQHVFSISKNVGSKRGFLDRIKVKFGLGIVNDAVQ